MESEFEIGGFDLICTVVDCGRGSEVLHTAKQHGVMGGTVFLGKAVTDEYILKFLPAPSIRKEVIWMLCSSVVAAKAITALEETFLFHASKTDMAFTTSVLRIVGSKGQNCEQMDIKREVQRTMYHAITIIVDKGKAEQVMDAAIAAGSKGGTIINARGSGVHETSKIFSMDIEPEKEIILIISAEENTKKIVTSIREQLKMDEPGNGLVFIQNINQAYGVQ